jgi:hypothetical protein
MAIVTAAALLAAMGAATAATAGSLSSRIVGGDVVSQQWPAQALLDIEKDGGQFICGGTLVAPLWVVTAAHCVTKDNDSVVGASGVQVTLGSTTFDGAGGTRHTVAQIVREPQWDTATNAYDAALLRLADPATETPLGVINQSEDAFQAPGQMARVIGWGTTYEGGPISSSLNGTDVVIQTDDDCNDGDSYAGQLVPAVMLCAGYPNGGADACQGDSGGPLMVDTGPADRMAWPEDWRLAGIVSWGEGCARPGLYGVYTEVANRAIRSWIYSTVGATRRVEGVAYDARIDGQRLEAGDTPDQARAAALVGGATATLQRRVDGAFQDVPPTGSGITPTVNPQLTLTGGAAAGSYGWDVPAGEYRVVVRRTGYADATTRAVTVPALTGGVHAALARQVPSASFSVDGVLQTGAQVTFVSTSSHPAGAGHITGYAWDLDGDGEFDDAAAPTATMAYSTAGARIVRLRVTDDDGDTAVSERAIDIRPSALAAPPAPLPPVSSASRSAPPSSDRIAPVLGHLRLAPRTVRPGSRSRLSFDASEAVTVVVSVEAARPGRRVGSACAAPSGANRRGTPCTRWVALPGRRTLALGKGRTDLALSRRPARRTLTPGRYRLVLRATDAAANPARTRRITFTVTAG